MDVERKVIYTLSGLVVCFILLATFIRNATISAHENIEKSVQSSQSKVHSDKLLCLNKRKTSVNF